MAAASPARTTNAGTILAQQLFDAFALATTAPLPGARELPILSGLDVRGNFSEPQENVLLRARQLLAATGRVFAYGNAVTLEARIDAEGPTLLPLRTGTVIEPHARNLLSNVMVCAAGAKQFAPPDSFAGILLLSEPLLETIPRIRLYARRPIFDQNFVLRNPAWHADPGILIHGTTIEPIPFQPPLPCTPPLQRLPHHLRTLLRGFCFRNDADLANTVGMYLTALLMNHFITTGKPIVLVDGNQPEVGKSLWVRILGILFDGKEPSPVRYTPDEEELQKSLCGVLRSYSAVLFIDNAKTGAGTGLSSPTIESQSLAPEVMFRILGKSYMFRRPNDFIWTITMNDTKACRDIVSRSIPIQLLYEGNAKTRTFNGPDPIDYAQEHRAEILGELAGMIMHWVQRGMQLSSHVHRCRHWAGTIGGILETGGLPEFLTNADAAANTINTALDELAALAEAVVEGGGPYIETGQNGTVNHIGDISENR